MFKRKFYDFYINVQDTQAAAAALTSLGHVYTAIGDYPNALASHKQCVQLVKQMGDRLQEAREIGNVGAVYLAMGEFDSAVDCHTQHLRLARRLGDQVIIKPQHDCIQLILKSVYISYLEIVIFISKTIINQNFL